MTDDLDALLRRAMKTLDAEAPSGYFEALPDRTLARLSGGEGSTMQQTGTPNRESSSPTMAAAPPPLDVAVPREEDSGLHDIRSLAQSTKQRLSNKRSTGPQQTLKDDDVLASSSASWKNLALPQPAKMVSLPAIDELPSKQEIAKQDKATKKAAKAAPVSASAIEASSSSSGSVEFKPAFSGFAQKAPQKSGASNKGRNLALVGMGLAAAAGITIFVVTQNTNDAAQPVVTATGAAPAGNANAGVSADRMKDLDDATAKLNAQHVAAQAAEAAPPAPPAEPAIGALASADKPAPMKAVAAPKSSRGGASKKPDKVQTTVTAEKPEVQTAKPAAKTGKGGEGDQDFDALLKEAGVDGKTKEAKPKLDKKQLSTEDFKKGMAAIAAKAQACYKGTQGSANVKLTIAPSGSVSKVTISGAFAGKPEAECVSAAVKGASFPAWDGGPQSFGYPILLSE
jgi:hypothetical protein